MKNIIIILLVAVSLCSGCKKRAQHYHAEPKDITVITKTKRVSGPMQKEVFVEQEFINEHE